ncbi:MAG: hypothetical protein ACYSUY_19430 [Planctomycetota bacterium]
MNIETGSGWVAAVAAVVIFVATVLFMNSRKAVGVGLMLDLLGYGIVYFGCLWILKGFTKEQKVRWEVDKKE